MVTAEKIRQAFKQQWGCEPDSIWQAPGRVNLMGDHTDYQEGLALPIAIEQSTWVVRRRRNDQMVRAISYWDDKAWTASVEELHRWAAAIHARQRTVPGWQAFLAGVYALTSEPFGADWLVM
ncbi:MAG: galactokinase family protein, partial [Firmicutes bacterium]|nr:galactokinase family protein [Bacillota bacterium]